MKNSKMIIFRFFFRRKLCIVWNSLIVKNYLDQKDIFVLRQFKMAANLLNSPGFSRGRSFNFWWLRSADYLKFTEECVTYTENYVLGTNHG